MRILDSFVDMLRLVFIVFEIRDTLGIEKPMPHSRRLFPLY